MIADSPSVDFPRKSAEQARIEILSRIGFAMGMTALLMFPHRSPSQASPAHNLRYRIFDVGTLGGPTSQTNGTTRIMNNGGIVAGMADSSQLCPHAPVFESPAFSWDRGVLTNLGLLPGGCGSLPNAINDRGTIVGSSDNDVFDPQSGLFEIHPDIRKKNGPVQDLGTFGGHFGLSNDVNNNDIVVGGAENEDLDSFNFGGNVLGLPSPTSWRAFAWRDGVLQNLGTLGGPDSFAFFVNDLDEIDGVSFTSSIPNPETGMPSVEPFIWKNGHMRSLGTLGGTFGYASNINNRSEIVGFSNLEGDAAAHAFDWSPKEGMKDIGGLGGTFSGATWVNEAGEIVGNAFTSDGPVHAVRWRRGKIEDLGTVAGLPCSVTAQINARGEIAGQSFDCADFSNGRATLWERDGSGIDLNEFLSPSSNLVLFESHFVNDRGEIVTVGVLPNGDQHIVVLVPCSSTESVDCHSAREETASAQTKSISESKSTHLSPESLAAIRARMTQRFPDIQHLFHK